ncbi:hypothetical protein QZH41_014864 [Actinostola sp. cb2023]|nr:hypothetical protein QZH41_014864 [Actinostola sp. cb2023]
MSATEEEGDEFEVFTIELDSTDPYEFIQVKPKRLAHLQKCTGQDPVLQTLKDTVLAGWPERREQAPEHISDYWNYRDEITVHNGVLFKSQRVIIPRVMRANTLSRIHSSHLGAESCLRKARDIVFWPGMTSDVKETVAKCSVCADYQAKNAKQPMQTQPVPDRPWSRLSADIFTLKGKEYISLVDHYSDFIEAGELADTTAGTVIQFLKEQFSRHGIPDFIVTDNAPQLVSHEFHQFSVDWEFEHVSSSPLYPKSNGKAESSVKVTKRLFKKALRDDKDPWLALLDQRNTPTEGLGSSPAQRLMSRRTKGLLPTASTLLHPKVVEGVKEKIKLKKQKAKYYHDRTAKTLPELEVGQDIRVAPTSKYQQWRRLADQSSETQEKMEISQLKKKGWVIVSIQQLKKRKNQLSEQLKRGQQVIQEVVDNMEDADYIKGLTKQEKELKDLCNTYRLAGVSIESDSTSKINFRLDTFCQGQYWEPYYIEVQSGSQLKILRHTIPYFIPISTIDDASLNSDIQLPNLESAIVIKLNYGSLTDYLPKYVTCDIKGKDQEHQTDLLQKMEDFKSYIITVAVEKIIS